MLVLVGNSPSSGSTVLADLLDSSNVTACGPELGLFCNKNLYSSDLGASILPSVANSPYSCTNGLNKNNLFAYGLDDFQLSSLFNSSESLEDFFNQFAYRYLVLRGKDINGVVFEKTPQNIDCIEHFLKASYENYFVSIVRHPENVIRSLVKRGFSPYVSAATWLTDVAQLIPYLNHPRVKVIKYEDLLTSPFIVASALIYDLSGSTVTPSDLESCFANNAYRSIFEERIDTWSVKTTGGIQKAKPTSELRYPWVRFMEINSRYSEFFGFSQISFYKAAQVFGYESLYADVEGSDDGDKHCFPTIADKKWFLRRWLSAFKRREAKVFDIPIFMNPLARLSDAKC